jgi:hypothetical protein
MTQGKDNAPAAPDKADVIARWLTYGSEETLLLETATAISDNLLIPDDEKGRLFDAISAIDAVREDTYHRSRLSQIAHEGIRSGAHAALQEATQRAAPREIYVKIHQQAVDLLAITRGNIIHAAKMGDWRLVAKYLREGGSCSKEMANFLADVLDGKIKRLNNNPPQMRTRVRDRGIVWFVLTERERGVKPDASIDNAASKFKLGRRRVQQIFEEHRSSEAPILDAVRKLQQQVDDLLQELGAGK